MDNEKTPSLALSEDHGEKLEQPERRKLVSKLAKAAVLVPIATFLYDASKNQAFAS